MQRNGAKRRLLSDMNVVPYIDVMLVLLIIFMITTPLLSRGVDVELPKADAQPITLEEIKERRPIVLSVDAQGRYFLNISGDGRTALDPDLVRTSVSQALSEDSARPVFVQGDHRVSYGRVVQAMVLLQKAGADKVGMITDPPEQEAGQET